MQCVEGGLPRVNRLVDICTALSIKHQIPIGAEDLDMYWRPPRLIGATGKEYFEWEKYPGIPGSDLAPVGEVV